MQVQRRAQLGGGLEDRREPRLVQPPFTGAWEHERAVETKRLDGTVQLGGGLFRNGTGVGEGGECLQTVGVGPGGVGEGGR